MNFLKACKMGVIIPDKSRCLGCPHFSKEDSACSYVWKQEDFTFNPVAIRKEKLSL